VSTEEVVEASSLMVNGSMTGNTKELWNQGFHWGRKGEGYFLV